MLSYEEVDGLVLSIYNDHTIDLFREGVDAVCNFTSSGLIDAFEQTLSTQPDRLPEEKISDILDNIRDALAYILQIQSIWTQGDLRLRDLTEIVNGTFEITHYEDKDTLHDILNSEQGCVEIFAELMALVTAHSPEKILTLVSRVDPVYITRLNDMLATHINPAQQVEEKIDMVKFYSHWKGFQMEQSYFADNYLSHPEQLGLPLKEYTRAYFKVAPDMLRPTQEVLSKVALELYALSLISLESCNNPIPALRPEAALLCSDERVSAELQRELLKINTERTKNGTNPVSH